jgi:prepilin-type N-terminal cleavage/methylation domain-containing protein
MKSRKAFTIIELTVVMAITSALFAITIPRASGFIDRIELRAAISEIESMFSLARHVAIARGAQSTLDIDAANGEMILRSSSGKIRTAELARAHGVTLSTNKTSITYSPIGVGYGAANFSLVVSRGRAVDTVVVSRLGRVRH